MCYGIKFCSTLSNNNKIKYYSEYSLSATIGGICEFGGLTGNSLVLVHCSLLVQYWEIVAD